MSGKTILIILTAAISLSACKNGGLFKKKAERSSVTGWKYDDKNMGNFHVAKVKYPKAGPGLVFVQGGSFVMGAKDEDVMGDWNNVPRRVTVPSFFIDETEVANVHYREYLYWIENTFGEDNTSVLIKALPDTLVWREELAYNEPYVESYFRFPSYNYYPVVGVNWQQAHDFCLWRTDRVNQLNLMDAGYLKKDNAQKDMKGAGADAFTTESYLLTPDNVNGKATPKKSDLKDVSGKPRKLVKMEDGILNMGYRLPTEAEWEYAAYAILAQNPRPRTKEKGTGEELLSNQQIYSWSQNPNGLRDNKRGSWQGKFLANFKRGSGDNMGVAGGLNDRAAIPASVKTFYPNRFGLYNMSGNVSEWVGDVYRPMTSMDAQDFNYFRGNKFQRYAKDANGEFQKDSSGRFKKVDISDDEVRTRANYQSNNVIDYLDGDSTSQVFYGSGVTSLISDKSRVIKGGSWNDRPYWLSPGTRRFMDETQAASTVGFRCAQTYLGPPEGPGFNEGNTFKTSKKQNSRKRTR